jgi:hypothetical protein
MYEGKLLLQRVPNTHPFPLQLFENDAPLRHIHAMTQTMVS